VTARSTWLHLSKLEAVLAAARDYVDFVERRDTMDARELRIWGAVETRSGGRYEKLRDAVRAMEESKGE
jgi:hypothetical protein